MLIHEVHGISSAYISGHKCTREANDVEENPGPTIFDITDNNNHQPPYQLAKRNDV